MRRWDRGTVATGESEYLGNGHEYTVGLRIDGPGFICKLYNLS